MSIYVNTLRRKDLHDLSNLTQSDSVRFAKNGESKIGPSFIRLMVSALGVRRTHSCRCYSLTFVCECFASKGKSKCVRILAYQENALTLPRHAAIDAQGTPLHFSGVSSTDTSEFYEHQGMELHRSRVALLLSGPVSHCYTGCRTGHGG